ncbi:MAG: ABC transporter ATP-binding protein [Aquificaceae bacterium]
MNKNILELKSVSKKFSTGFIKKRTTVALSNVSFNIPQGKIFALVGESGSGKTTTAKLILRLEKPDSGKITLFEKDIYSYGKEYARKVSFVFQDPRSSLNPRMKVFDIVSEPVRIQGLNLSRSEIESLVIKSLVASGLDDSFLNKKPTALSGGQSQRVAIARALILNPALLVADEPTASLDASHRATILETFREINSRGTSIMLITHDLKSALKLADIVGIMFMGHLVELGPIDQVFKSPMHPYTIELLSSALQKQDQSQIIEESDTLTSSGCVFFNRCKQRKDTCKEGVKEVSLNGRRILCNLY